MVGVVTGPHGLRGELKIHPMTDDLGIFAEVESVLVGDLPDPIAIADSRIHRSSVLLLLEGIDTREKAEALRGASLKVSAAAVSPLEDREFFLYQIVGLDVTDESGASLGVVTDVIFTGANDVFVIESSERKQPLLLPGVPEVILEVSPTERRMLVRPPLYETEPS